MKKIISFEGYCPHQEVRYSIQITYSEYSPLGARFFVKKHLQVPLPESKFRLQYRRMSDL